MSSRIRNTAFFISLLFMILSQLAASELQHTVQKGDSLYALALRYDCSVEDLKSLNDLERDTLYKGELIRIPGKFPDKHMVIRGESLSHIARKYDIPQEKLISLNRLSSENLRIGQELELIRPPLDGEIWEVKKGDTLSWISLKFDISQARLKQINNLAGESLRLGQEIQLTADRPQTMIVSTGDSLWKISKNYGLAIDDLKRWNALEGDGVYQGMELQLYSVVLDLSDEEQRVLPAQQKLPEALQNEEKAEIQLAQVSISPNLYYSKPTERRTQPGPHYSEEDLEDPMVNYNKASALLRDFDKAVGELPALSQDLKGYTIILDPGHGGLDPGAIVENSDGYGNKVYVVEDEYSYDISLRVYRDLLRHGADVHMTVISPNQTIRTTEDASLTFVNEKNEVYNSKTVNRQNRSSVWPVGNAWGLDQRKIVAKENLKGVRQSRSIFLSIHADNNPGDGEGTRILYHPDARGTNSENLAKELSKYMGLDSSYRTQELRVLRDNPAGSAVLVEVRNLAYKNNAWAIRNETLRQDDANRIVKGIVSFCK